jgi:hypothetical protein
MLSRPISVDMLQYRGRPAERPIQVQTESVMPPSAFRRLDEEAMAVAVTVADTAMVSMEVAGYRHRYRRRRHPNELRPFASQHKEPVRMLWDSMGRRCA